MPEIVQTIMTLPQWVEHEQRDHQTKQQTGNPSPDDPWSRLHGLVRNEHVSGPSYPRRNRMPIYTLFQYKMSLKDRIDSNRR